MTRDHRFRLLLVLAIVLGLCSLSRAQQSGDQFHWSSKLAANQLVQIKNINGPIDAEGIQGDTVDVTAVKGGPDRDKVRIEVVQNGEGVTICAVYPGGSCSGDGSSHEHGDIKAHVDFTVKVPRNLRFSATNVNGRVKAEDLGRAVKVTTVNGGIDVSTSAWVAATSVNGSIKAAMGAAEWDGKLKIATVNGSVTLAMPTDLNAEVRFSSVNGNLSSDFPLTTQGGSFSFGPKHIHGTIGKGGRELEVSTVNGSLHINKGKSAM
jgi:Putative adhesin